MKKVALIVIIIVSSITIVAQSVVADDKKSINLINQRDVLEREIDRTSKEIIAVLTKQQKKGVLIFKFSDNDGKETKLGRFIEEEFSSKLIENTTSIKVFERERLTQIARQQKVDIERIMEPKQFEKIRKLVEVDSILVGTILELDGKKRVGTRLISLEIGDTFFSSKFEIPINSLPKELLENKPSTIGIIKENKQTTLGLTETIAKEIQDDYSFEVKSCTLLNQTITCNLLITNLLPADQYLALRFESKLTDENGEVYSSNGVDIAGRGMQGTILTSKIPVKSSVTFKGIKSTTTQIKLFRLYYQRNDWRVFAVDFKDLPIRKEN